MVDLTNAYTIRIKRLNLKKVSITFMNRAAESIYPKRAINNAKLVKV